MKLINFVKNIIFFLFLLPSITSIAISQKSDYEIFLDFKNELKTLKTNFRSAYIPKKTSEEKSIKNDLDNYLSQIYSDYSNKNSQGLKDLIPVITEKFNTFKNGRMEGKSEILSKVDDFLKKWNAAEKKSIVDKVGKDYDLDFSEQIGLIEDIKTDLELESNDTYDRLRDFLVVIIEDKGQLIGLKDSIDNISSRVKRLLAEQSKDKKIINDMLSDNNRRKELILKLVNTIIAEHRLIPSSDVANFKPSPFSSEIYNTLNSFIDDYVNLNMNLKGDPDPEILKNTISAQKDFSSKFDSLYESCEKAKMLNRGERDQLIQKSKQWKEDLYLSLDNLITKEFVDNGVPIIFNRNNTNDWFIQSINEFITPYTISTDPVNSDKSKSKKTFDSFSNAWNNIKTKWEPALIESGYLNVKSKTDIDNKFNSWRDIVSSGIFSKPWVLIGIIGTAIAILGIFLILLLKKKK